MTGGWKRVVAKGGKFSDLEIDSDDCFVLLLEMKKCPVVCVQLNYMDQKPRREIVVNLENKTIKADLINNTMEINGEINQIRACMNHTYLRQHKSILAEEHSNACTFEQGMDVLNLICAAELAVERNGWINNEESLHHLCTGRLERSQK